MINKEIAILTDGGKSELIRSTNGQIIVTDQPYFISLSPKGTKVLSLDEAKELLDRREIPTYKCNVKK